MKTNSADEVLDFWQDTQNYRSLTDAERSRDGCRVFRTFVAENAASPVKLAVETKAALVEAFESVCASELDELADPAEPTIFDQANVEAKEILTQHVVSFMSEDSFKQVRGSKIGSFLF